MMANRTTAIETQDVVVDNSNVLALRELDIRVTLGQAGRSHARTSQRPTSKDSVLPRRTRARGAVLVPCTTWEACLGTLASARTRIMANNIVIGIKFLQLITALHYM